VETLDAFARFAREQADLLCEAREALQRALDEAAKAHRSVVEHFERLSVVERLRERRAMDAGRDVARTEQKRLDDQALIRLAAELAGSTSKSNEE
jgi:hypothetical protein